MCQVVRRDSWSIKTRFKLHYFSFSLLAELLTDEGGEKAKYPETTLCLCDGQSVKSPRSISLLGKEPDMHGSIIWQTWYNRKLTQI